MIAATREISHKKRQEGKSCHALHDRNNETAWGWEIDGLLFTYCAKKERMQNKQSGRIAGKEVIMTSQRIGSSVLSEEAVMHGPCA